MKQRSLSDQIVRPVTEFLWGRATAEDRTRGARSAGSSDSSAASAGALVERRFQDLFAAKDAIAAGGLQIVGLDKVRRHFGEGWQQMAAKVHQFTSNFLGTRLAPGDAYFRHGDLAYAVVFANATVEEARSQCAFLARELVTRLIGECGFDQGMQVKTAVIRVEKSSVAGQNNPLGIVSRLLEEEMRAQEAEPSRRQPPRSGVQQDPARRQERPPQRAALPTRAERSNDPPGRPASSARKAAAVPSDLEFVYRPVWDVTRDVLMPFVSLPARPTAQRGLQTGYRALPGPDSASSRAELDILSLRHAISDLDRLARQGHYRLICCPCRFETIATKYRDAYLSECARITGFMRNKLIMFEVVDLPSDVCMSDLAEIARALLRFGKAVNIQVSLDADLEDFEDLGLQAVGVDLEQHPHTEARLMTALDAFVARAKVQGLQTFAYGIRSLSLASAAVGAGVDFIAGDTVAPVCRNLEKVYRFRLSELFGVR